MLMQSADGLVWRTSLELRAAASDEALPVCLQSGTAKGETECVGTYARYLGGR